MFLTPESPQEASVPRLFGAERTAIDICAFMSPVSSPTRQPFLYSRQSHRESAFIMAGAVRQPIDIQSLERYLNQNVPDIKTPVEVKQVSFFDKGQCPILLGSDINIDCFVV